MDVLNTPRPSQSSFSPESPTHVKSTILPIPENSFHRQLSQHNTLNWLVSQSLTLLYAGMQNDENKNVL